MTNLVSRLRDWKGNDFGPYRSPVPDLLEAADEIERLERALWLAYEKSRNDDEQIRDYAARLSAEPGALPNFVHGSPVCAICGQGEWAHLPHCPPDCVALPSERTTDER